MLFLLTAYMEAGDLDKNKINLGRKRKKRSIVKREAPYIIYPEILVIVDYDGYRFVKNVFNL